MKPFVFAAVVLGVCSTVTPIFAATSSELREQPLFASSNHVLDIQIIAKAKVVQLGDYSPTAWVYTVCYRKDAEGNSCPDDGRTAAEYGGMRLQLEPGDHLKIHFINQLPPVPPDAKHLGDPMGAMLIGNPTNLHTHGLIVEPRQATATNPTYGDYVYLLAYPTGQKPTMAMPGLDLTDQPLDYDIYVPLNHPSGSYWIHPHVHGLALNQVSYGLAGTITVGSPTDYLTGPASHAGHELRGGVTVRNMMLKDIEVTPDGKVMSQEDPDFCMSEPNPDEAPRDGSCAGQSYTDEGGILHDYKGGKWFSTINGQVFPTIHASPQGEIWRISTASGSRTYQLALNDGVTGKPLAFQVLAVDGITLNGNMDASGMGQASGGKVKPVPCPEALKGVREAVCATAMHLMPSARVEIWIPPMPGHKSAVLLSNSYDTGPAGDDWPSIRLAQVEFPGSGWGESGALKVKAAPGNLLAKAGLLGSDVKIDGGRTAGEIPLQAGPAMESHLSGAERMQLHEHLNALTAPEGIPSAPCVTLPEGHRRRVFFGLPTGNPYAFGLGYEEVDRRGRPVPGTFQDITPFDHSVINVCVPLAEGNTTATEEWELVNVSGEDHNFHIHQTKFHVLDEKNSAAPPNALMDNVPLLHGSNACDGSVETWRDGACQVKPVVVSIPFSEVGDFVYHCHILEHEDGGMMAHIRVVPAK